MKTTEKPTILELCGRLKLDAPVSHADLIAVVRAIAAAGEPCNVDGELWWQRYAGLDPDAPDPPSGMVPRAGIEYGCGNAQCSACYERAPVARILSEAWM